MPKGNKKKKSKPTKRSLLPWDSEQLEDSCTRLNPWVVFFFSLFFIFFVISLFYHRNSSDYDKIIAAAADFSGRAWPTIIYPESGPTFIWEKVI